MDQPVLTGGSGHHVRIHSDVDSFGSALVDFHDRSAAASGQSRTDQSRQRDRDRALLGQVSGFTDREHRVVHLAPSAETRTAVHELLHDLSDPAIEALGTPIDEGITEALTRRVLRPAGIPNRGSAYEAFADIAELLIDAVGLELVGSAYFRGEVPALRGAVGQGSGDRWTDLTRAWVSGDRDGATRALAGVRHAPG